MVEVEDISLVPKTVKCSYKALTDERDHVYSVNLSPAMTCLPVSQWNEETYKSYAKDGCSGGYIEQGWSSTVEVPRRAPRREVGGGSEEAEEEVESRQVAHHVPRNAALIEGAVEAGHAGFWDQNVAMEDLLEELRERQRKEKSIQIKEGHGPAGRGEGLGRPINISSGSDSCDPHVMGAQLTGGSAASDDADSRVGPSLIKRSECKDDLDQDVDMGGEAAADGGVVGEDKEAGEAEEVGDTEGKGKAIDETREANLVPGVQLEVEAEAEKERPIAEIKRADPGRGGGDEGD